jgi:hypothetical protein
MADIGSLNPEQMLEQQRILRQQKMAEMLMQQGMQQPQSQMVSGRYVAPSIFQNLAGLANQYVGQKGIERAEQAQLKMAKELREQGVQETQRLMNVFGGRAAIPEKVTEMVGPYGMSGAGQNVPMPTATIDGQPAIEANPRLAFAEAINMTSPQARALLPQIAAEAFKKPKWEKDVRYDDKGREIHGWTNTADPSLPFAAQTKKPEMSPYERASLNLRAGDQEISRANLQFNTGMTVGGGGVPIGAPAQAAPAQPTPTIYRTINQGSPILAPNQPVPQQNVASQMPQQEVMPIFKSKAEQEVWVAAQKEKNKLQVEAQAALPTALNTVESGINAIKGMIGDTTVNDQGNLVYGKVKPHKGFNDAVGFPSLASGFGATAYIKGSDWKDFERRFSEIEGKSFLAAIESLRGTGAISEAEGAKATTAINRMSLQQSPAEFVQAANELRNVMTKGYQAAQQKAGVKPFNLTAQPNVGGSKPAMPRYNLQTGQWE